MTAIEKAIAALDRIDGYISPNSKKREDYQRDISAVREALSELRAAQGEKVEGLEVALTNAIRPEYDIHTTCPECSCDIVVDNGEWLIWCGTEKHAHAILKAAKLQLERQRG